MLSTGTAGAALADKNITTTKPVSASGIHIADLKALGYFLGNSVPKYINFTPIVGDADGETGSYRIWKWNRFEPTGPAGTIYWVPNLLVHFVATATDQSAAAIDAATTPFFCDAISVSYGDANVSVISPSNDALASILVHIRGAELVEIDFVTGTGANLNGLYQFVDQ